MNDTTLPQVGSQYRIGETDVSIIGLSKRGRGYQVHVLIDGDHDRTERTLRLKDFNKKATQTNA
jgi:hypothetical protein